MNDSCGIKKLYRGAGRGYGSAGRICQKHHSLYFQPQNNWLEKKKVCEIYFNHTLWSHGDRKVCRHITLTQIHDFFFYNF